MNTIHHFVALTDRIGTAGQPTADQFALIAQAGYDHVINLAMPDHPGSLADEGDRVTRQGMTYHHLPVPFASPAPHHVRRFCHLLTALLASDPGSKVFIHCIMNYRVAAFIYHYRRKVDGCDDRVARSPMFDQWSPEPAWAALLDWTADDIGL